MAPKTRASRRVAARAAERQLLHLSRDELACVLFHLPLAHDIAAAAPSCRQLRDAALQTFLLRPFSGEVVTLDLKRGGHTGSVFGVAAAPDGYVITGSQDCTVRVWHSGVCVSTLAVGTPTHTLALLPDGERFVAVCELSNTAKLWTIDGVLERSFDAGGDIAFVAAHPDGVHFALGLFCGDVKLYHVDGTHVHTFEGHASPVEAVTVTPDGQHIISGAANGIFIVWSVAEKGPVGNSKGHTRGICAVAAMPDNQRFLSGSQDYTVRVWLLNGTLKNIFTLHTDYVYALVALPDNQHALSGSRDHTVKLFDVNDGAVLRNFNHHTSPVMSLALLPDGLRFASGSSDDTARILEHGLAVGPSQAWIDAKPKREQAAAAAARVAREQSLRESAEVRVEMERELEKARARLVTLQARMDGLTELEAAVETPDDVPTAVMEAASELSDYARVMKLLTAAGE